MKQPPLSFRSRLDVGLEGIEVRLWEPLDAQYAANTIASFYLSTWGDPIHADSWHANESLQRRAWKYAQDAMDGKVLPNTLESIPLTFSITGISRATTHQLVRSRVGAVFGQQGGRDNNWSNFNLRLPQTWNKTGLSDSVRGLQQKANELYQEAIESGVPFQDARYVLPMGLETSLVASYNLLSFKGLADRRLCNRMMWETNHVVRMMADLVAEAFPFVGRNLRSSCEKRGTCGSVSPMFPPSCLTHNGQMVVTANDNKTLADQMGGSDDYDFEVTQNGTWLHYANEDRRRLELEHQYIDSSYSLLDKGIILMKEEGIWTNA